MKRKDVKENDLAGKKVTVLGLGISGEAAAELLLRRGAVVTVLDDMTGDDLNDRSDRLRLIGATVILGSNAGLPAGAELLVASPGIPLSHRLVRSAREEHITVIGELELAYRFLNRPLIAITGTNGKTTTVSLLKEIFLAAGIPCVTGGNIGYPLSRIVLSGSEDDLVVVEASSFQLERTMLFRPTIAVLLNMTVDHLDRYSGMEDYRSAKLRIFQNQGDGDLAVLPLSLLGLIESVIPPGVKKVPWGNIEEGVSIVDGILGVCRSGEREVICRLDQIALRGVHNLENVMAAVTVAINRGIGMGAIKSALADFQGVPHRLEYVASVGSVEYYNDSKATNPGSVVAALSSFARPVIWLAGGSDKGLDLSALKESLPGSVKLAVLMGDSRERLRKLVEGIIPFRIVPDLDEAVAVASRAAESGDIVLLSPGYASFDMFRNYQERGEVFKSLVRELID